MTLPMATELVSPAPSETLLPATNELFAPAPTVIVLPIAVELVAFKVIVVPNVLDPALLVVLAIVVLLPTACTLLPLPAVLGVLILMLSPKANELDPFITFGSPTAYDPAP